MLQPVAAVALSACLLASVSALPGMNRLVSPQRIAQTALTKAHTFAGLDACPAPNLLPKSCINGESPEHVDGCCTNTPGGQILQTQFWDTDPATGPDDSWTVHGLWPDNCDGTYQEYCDPDRQYTDIEEILANYGGQDVLDYMNVLVASLSLHAGRPLIDLGACSVYWKDDEGTCISTLNTTCYGRTYTQYEEVVDYFDRAVALFKTLPTYTWLAAAGIHPSTSQTYTLAQLQSVAVQNFGYEAIWGCTDDNELDEVWYGYTTRGPVKGGKFEAAAPDGAKSSCPDTGIKYLPKNSTSGSSGGTSSSNSTTDTDKVFLNGSSPPALRSQSYRALSPVVANGAQNGCLISSGRWYTTGTCAGYRPSHTSADNSTFTLSTSKGPCAVTDAGELSCASGNEAATFGKVSRGCPLFPCSFPSSRVTDSVDFFHQDANTYLTYASSPDFYASELAAGQTQVVVSTNEEAVSLKIVYAPQ
ncbi:SPOSA6832_00069 [Sporobolomyces salmonicolor]|uniref:Ribonuclease T2-like n=1 Tax=Sporidiobolus salmonicolor TaxID=5005 RepID=A0A0D6EFQ4_SPOSA|nr:SPOSA6832_00069 [Sporobolomyces salmonicolor]